MTSVTVPLVIVALGENVFQLENGNGGRKPGQYDAVKILFGSIETNFTTKIPKNPALPSALEDENLEEFLITHDGSYGSMKARQTLSSTILAAIQNMTPEEKVLIEEKEQEQHTVHGKGGRVSAVKLVDIFPQDFTNLWEDFKDSLKDLQRAMSEMPKKLTLEALKTIDDFPQLQQLQASLERFQLVVDDPIAAEAFPYWPEYFRDVKGLLAEVGQYVRKFIEQVKSSRFSKIHLLREIQEVVMFYKEEFQKLHPGLWKEKGLKRMRDAQKEESLTNKLRMLKLSEKTEVGEEEEEKQQQQQQQEEEEEEEEEEDEGD